MENSITTLEQRILRGVIDDRGLYEAFGRFGDRAALSPIGRRCLEIVGGYYDTDGGVRRCDVGTVLDRAGREANPKHARALSEFVRDLPGDVSLDNVLRDITELRRGYIADKLSLALANRSPEVKSLLAEYAAIQEAPASEDDCGPEVVEGDDVSDLEQPGAGSSGEHIRLWPKSLDSLVQGNARRGHQILVFGRPESGKTLVCINLIAGFLSQGLRVLYVANEEPVSDIRTRIRQRILKWSRSELLADPKASAAALSFLSSGAWRVAGLSPGTIPEIRKQIEDFRPDVLVLDQLRNLRVAGGTRVEELENAATEARNLGKRYRLLVVAVTQAGDSASGKLALELNDVDGSKTGIPAQADLMIGVGNTMADWDAGNLTLTTCKNKLSGRHESITVKVNKQTGVISDG